MLSPQMNVIQSLNRLIKFGDHSQYKKLPTLSLRKVGGLSALNWVISFFLRQNLPEEKWDEFEIVPL